MPNRESNSASITSDSTTVCVDVFLCPGLADIAS